VESQRVAGVEVRRWSAPFPTVDPADIVVEGLGVRLPDAYIEAMAARRPQPVWVNLEYLSAEQWVEGCHGLPSPQSSLPLTKHFFFPGFTDATGGLLIERGLARMRDEFQRDSDAMAAFWRALDLPPADGAGLRISLFCYENGALPTLVDAWSKGPLPITCVVPEGKALAQLSRIAGEPLAPGSRYLRDWLTVAAVPFLDLDAYDRLLWACDVNFVRGEDSFVRAQLAARPAIWQAYPQEEAAHFPKVAAFVERYGEQMEAEARRATRELTEAWNRESTAIGTHWDAWCGHRRTVAPHAQRWAARLEAGGNLASKLAEFCENRLK
jgi:uncharacterized repeat protein (TIGR03837 family)